MEVTVKDRSISDIRLIQSQASIQALTQELTQRILTEQDTDAVSGATASSKCLLKAVENALTRKP